MKPAVTMHKVTQVYVAERGANLAVEDIDFAVEQGEFVSLVGPSGCGKTTILSMIAGLFRPTSGEIRLFGKRVKGPSPLAGYMLQQDYLFPWRTIFDNAMIGLEILGKANADSRGYVQRLLREMGLAEAVDRYPCQLSGGMRQRVALVRTLSSEPELLLLDEPFSALDYQTKLQLEDLVWDTIRKRKKTALLVTHDITEAIAMSDRVIVLGSNPGRIREMYQVPERIRSVRPFEAREQPGFHALFRDIWEQLGTAAERKGGERP